MSSFRLTCQPGTGSVTFTLEDSEDGKNFTSVAAYGPIVAEKIVRDVAFPFPLHHRRYVRVKTAVTGTVSTLAGTLAVADNFSDPARYWRDEVEFYKPDPDASKIDLATRAKGKAESAASAGWAATASSARLSQGTGFRGEGQLDLSGYRSTAGSERRYRAGLRANPRLAARAGRAGV